MKKLMVLALVLGVVGLANAGLKITGYDGSTLKTGDSVTLSIVAENLVVDDYAYFALVADPAMGALGTGTKGSVGNLTELFGGVYLSYFPAEGMAGIDGYVGDSTGAALNGVVVGEITLVVTGKSTFDVSLITSGDFVNFDTAAVSINVIPEPMTMGLLALGGLFIRRKK